MAQILCKEITNALEELCPLSYQESWDNCGWQVGDPETRCTGVLLSVEATESIVEEAIQKGANLIITHHPLLFHALKRISTQTYIERVVILALQNNIGIYAAHTNLDNAPKGINYHIAQRLNLKNCRPLVPSQGQVFKLNIMVPLDAINRFETAILEAGAGKIGANYDQCSFKTKGKGSFRPIDQANPFIGELGKREEVEEISLQVVVQKHNLAKVIQTIKNKHPYEEPAFDIIALENSETLVGTGMIGELATGPISEKELLNILQKWQEVDSISFSKPLGKEIKRVALCGGSGGSFLEQAMREKADVYITGEAKYNDFLDAQGNLFLITLGHFESEYIARSIFKDIISAKFPNFVILEAENDINPVNYQYGKETN